MAIEATSRLLDQAKDVTTSTTTTFFKNIQLPAAK
jgi:hypothetical protein